MNNKSRVELKKRIELAMSDELIGDGTKAAFDRMVFNLAKMFESFDGESDALAVMKELTIINSNTSGFEVLNIHDSDRILYSGCEFRSVTIVIADRASNAFHCCLFRDCKFIYENSELSVTSLLHGCNTALDCSFNGEEIKDLRT